MTPFCAPFPCYIFPRWRRPRPHAAFPSWIYAATEQQNKLTKTARSVSPLVSFCVVPPRLVLRLVPPSRFASRLVSCRLVVSFLRLVMRLVLYRAVVPPRPSRLAMRRNGAVLRFASRVVVGRFLTRYARLVSSCLVGGSVSWRGACRENELAKTAHLPSLSLSSHQARVRLVGAICE